MSDYHICGGGLVCLFLLLGFMSNSKITVFRRLAKFAVLLMFLLLLIMVFLMMQNMENTDVPSDDSRIARDLRDLKSAASLFHDEHKKWPSPGQAASLDEYSDRPIVNATPSRYARVILLERPFGEVGSVDLYVGVELLPRENGHLQVQRKLALRAGEHGLLQESASGDGLIPYKSGLNVYMKVN